MVFTELIKTTPIDKKIILKKKIVMTKKVYAVLQQWQDRCGSVDTVILGVTYSLDKANQILQEERDTILENYKQSLDEMKKDDCFVVEDSDEHFFLADTIVTQWDVIDIIEQQLKD